MSHSLTIPEALNWIIPVLHGIFCRLPVSTDLVKPVATSNWNQMRVATATKSLPLKTEWRQQQPPAAFALLFGHWTPRPSHLQLQCVPMMSCVGCFYSANILWTGPEIDKRISYPVTSKESQIRAKDINCGTRQTTVSLIYSSALDGFN